MIGILKQNVGEIPSLVVVDSEKQHSALPAVVYYHGITSAKEHNLPLAFLLAEKGYRVILPDSLYHGERQTNEIPDVRYYLFNIVIQNIKELNEIKNDLEKQNLLLDGRIGVAGTSMGGITTASALTQYPWIKAAAVLMGSPKITTFARELVDVYVESGELPLSEQEVKELYDLLFTYDLSEQKEKLKDRPLLFWHGDHDQTVPFDHSYSFYQQVKDHYTNEENLKFLREKNRDHKVSRFAILETVKWFDSHL
ncbi:alpha/beta fold hydrolase [Ornithinibacillus bavariensis]|uniref:Esterase YitV n=1 Tax=Ornithinibacillus bavariensis TaxID=545502 RepID=A0A920C5N7_9BACI|nr:alpha/beta fold hydrolase [Ornithinibacillus bavariensis]GIO25738.1 putative esterase YitV [Ornithinibacillus bavariensis]HAM79857.1 esterase [Ornithinibacillus sp.]